MDDLGANDNKIQYATRLAGIEHKEVSEAVIWLRQNKYPVGISKADIIRYALINLVSFVKFKKAKNNGAAVEQKQKPVPVEQKQPVPAAQPEAIPAEPGKVEKPKGEIHHA